MCVCIIDNLIESSNICLFYLNMSRSYFYTNHVYIMLTMCGCTLTPRITVLHLYFTIA